MKEHRAELQGTIRKYLQGSVPGPVKAKGIWSWAAFVLHLSHFCNSALLRILFRNVASVRSVTLSQLGQARRGSIGQPLPTTKQST